MRTYIKSLILLLFFVVFGVAQQAYADSKRWYNEWTRRHNEYNHEIKKFQPFLTDERHEQIPQWDHKEWYAEDWLAQEENPEDLIRRFYEGGILWDQVTQTKKNRKGDEQSFPILVVGPNFYRLSGYDKRRVAHVVDIVYGVTKSKENGYFELYDWNTRMPIGTFNKDGLTLH